MTYYELWQDAIKKLDHNEITLGEYEKLIMPLHREVDTLDKIRAEIMQYNRRPSHYPCDMISIGTVLQIIDKYMKSEGKE